MNDHETISSLEKVSQNIEREVPTIINALVGKAKLGDPLAAEIILKMSPLARQLLAPFPSSLARVINDDDLKVCYEHVTESLLMSECTLEQARDILTIRQDRNFWIDKERDEREGIKLSHLY